MRSWSRKASVTLTGPAKLERNPLRQTFACCCANDASGEAQSAIDAKTVSRLFMPSSSKPVAQTGGVSRVERLNWSLHYPFDGAQP